MLICLYVEVVIYFDLIDARWSAFPCSVRCAGLFCWILLCVMGYILAEYFALFSLVG